MIPNPETLTRIRYEAEAYAANNAHGMMVAVENAVLPSERGNAVRAAIRAAFLRGADAGYTARCAEECKP